MALRSAKKQLLSQKLRQLQVKSKQKLRNLLNEAISLNNINTIQQKTLAIGVLINDYRGS